MVVLHFQVVDSIGCIGSRIYRAKVKSESMNECRPVVYSSWSLICIQDEWFKELKGHTMTVGQSKVNLSIIIEIGGVVTEIEVAEKNEIVELITIGTIESVRLPNFSCMGVDSQCCNSLVMSIIAWARLTVEWWLNGHSEELSSSCSLPGTRFSGSCSKSSSSGIPWSKDLEWLQAEVCQICWMEDAQSICCQQN